MSSEQVSSLRLLLFNLSYDASLLLLGSHELGLEDGTGEVSKELL